MTQTMIYLDSLDWIERYSWFGYFVSLFLLNFAAHLLSLFSGRAPMYTIVRFPFSFWDSFQFSIQTYYVATGA